jgi:IS5 family transposase
MARRRIGQEELLARAEPRAAASLSQRAGLIDRAAIDRHLVGISAAAKGERGWSPLALLTALRALPGARALLLASWHELSDVTLAEALDERAGFRRFCGFAAHEPTPERTAFVRVRRALVRGGLDRVLFDAVTRQLEANGAIVRTGTLGRASPASAEPWRHGARGDRLALLWQMMAKEVAAAVWAFGGRCATEGGDDGGADGG